MFAIGWRVPFCVDRGHTDPEGSATAAARCGDFRLKVRRARLEGRHDIAAAGARFAKGPQGLVRCPVEPDSGLRAAPRRPRRS